MARALRTSMACLSLLIGLAVSPLGIPPEAKARVSIDINIGTNLNFGRRISCSQGERLLRNRGFRDVSRRNCSGRYFIYRGTRRGSRWEIAVQSRNGRIADVHWLRRA
jgi:hypothetical protein